MHHRALPVGRRPTAGSHGQNTLTKTRMQRSFVEVKKNMSESISARSVGSYLYIKVRLENVARAGGGSRRWTEASILVWAEFQWSWKR